MKYFFRKKKVPEETKKVEAFLKEEKKIFDAQKSEPKLLILGSSDSGKSTLLKQMKLLHGGGFNEKEKANAVVNVKKNLFDVCVFLYEKLKNESAKQKYEELYTFALNWSPSYQIPESVVDSYVDFWNEAEARTLYEENEKILPCTIAYFLNDAKRLLPAKEVTVEDILNLRVTTLAINVTIFQVGKGRIHFFDVSGLKYHRTAWFGYFDHVNTILFVASLSCYDQTLVEDNTTNRMVDSLKLFHDTCQHKLLQNAGIVLFLNKKDIFKKKIQKVKISDYFNDYTGEEGSVSQGSKFFLERFLEGAKRKNPVASHFTCCTDTDSMSKLLDDITHNIIKQSIERIGIGV